MTYADLVALTAARAGLSRADVRSVLNAALETAAEQLKGGDEVALKGLGKLSVVYRPARLARNPLTGARVQVPGRKKVVFRPSQDLKKSGRGEEVSPPLRRFAPH